MKKITLFIFVLSAFTWEISAQFTFPAFGPTNVPGATVISTSLNDVSNTAGVTAGVYNNFTVTVNWSDTGIGDGAWSSEAQLRIVTAAGASAYVTSPGGANSGASVALTFSGTLAGNYDPSIDGLLSIDIDQTYTNSEAIWDNVSVTISPAPPVPYNDDCTSITPTSLTNGTSVTFTGTTLGATMNAAETSVLGTPTVWEAVTLSGACNSLTIDYCGTPAGNMTGNMWIVYTDCLTDYTVGEYNFTTCPDGNGTLYFYNLPAGTYYLPVISDSTNNLLGDYVMNVISEDCPSEPECAIAPISPVNGTVDVPNGDITLSWTAPSTGPAPTDYEVFFGETSGSLTSLGLVGSTDTFIDLTGFDYGVTYYWSIIPYNGTTPATGPCAEWNFTMEMSPGYCLNAPYGQYPTSTAGFTPTTCDGTTSNDIVTNAWAGEYSLVNVTLGQTYQFNSSIGTDFITISDAAGTAPYAYDEGSVTWTSTLDGQVRFYTHLSDQCGSDDVSRTRSVLCGASLSTDDFNNQSLFSYYPNPVNNTLTLNAQLNIQQVSVRNMLGQEVLKATPNTVNSVLDMSNLTSGSYFVNVTVEGVSETIRIIKE